MCKNLVCGKRRIGQNGEGGAAKQRTQELQSPQICRALSREEKEEEGEDEDEASSARLKLVKRRNDFAMFSLHLM